MLCKRGQYIAKHIGVKLIDAYAVDLFNRRQSNFPPQHPYHLIALSLDSAFDTWKQDNTCELSAQLVKQHVIELLQFADPTNNYQYLQWIVNQYCQRSFMIEDCGQIYNDLYAFDQHKRHLQPEQRDIGRYNHVFEVAEVVQSLLEQPQVLSNKEERKRQEQFLFDTSQVTLFYKSDTLTVLIPHTQEASCWFGIGTRWCTAATQSTNYFNQYNKQGYLYIIIHDGNKYQFHFETNSMHDHLDRRISLLKLVKQIPELKKAFNDIGIKRNIMWLVHHLTPEILVNWLDHLSNAHSSNNDASDGELFGVSEFLSTISPSLITDQVVMKLLERHYSLAMKYASPQLRNTQQFNDIVLTTHPEKIVSVPKQFQTYDIVKQVLTKSPTMLRYVRPDLMRIDELLKLAIRKSPQVLGHIPHHLQTPQIIELALETAVSPAVQQTVAYMIKSKELRKKYAHYGIMF